MPIKSRFGNGLLERIRLSARDEAKKGLKINLGLAWKLLYLCLQDMNQIIPADVSTLAFFL